jgi:hypothetical protein
MPEGVNPDDPGYESQLDEDDPGEVPTSFATKGVGWSGREEQQEEDEA